MNEESRVGHLDDRTSRHCLKSDRAAPLRLCSAMAEPGCRRGRVARNGRKTPATLQFAGGPPQPALPWPRGRVGRAPAGSAGTRDRGSAGTRHRSDGTEPGRRALTRSRPTPRSTAVPDAADRDGRTRSAAVAEWHSAAAGLADAGCRRRLGPRTCPVAPSTSTPCHRRRAEPGFRAETPPATCVTWGTHYEAASRRRPGRIGVREGRVRVSSAGATSWGRRANASRSAATGVTRSPLPPHGGAGTGSAASRPATASRSLRRIVPRVGRAETAGHRLHVAGRRAAGAQRDAERHRGRPDAG